MTNRQRSLLIGAAQVALVAMLGAKLLLDRARLPHGWAMVMAYDPELPIRGRYIRLTLVVPPVDSAASQLLKTTGWPQLRVVADRVMTGIGTGDAGQSVYTTALRGDSILVLRDPVAYFIPDQIADPSIRPAGEHLWAEVTVPRRGPPRPIRLGVSKGDGPIVPLLIAAQ
ncbi:MAG: hypothetical protein ABI765_03595 [Gemmatimonadota bacterium]